MALPNQCRFSLAGSLGGWDQVLAKVAIENEA